MENPATYTKSLFPFPCKAMEVQLLLGVDGSLTIIVVVFIFVLCLMNVPLQTNNEFNLKSAAIKLNIEYNQDTWNICIFFGVCSDSNFSDFG